MQTALHLAVVSPHCAIDHPEKLLELLRVLFELEVPVLHKDTEHRTAFQVPDNVHCRLLYLVVHAASARVRASGRSDRIVQGS